MASVDDEFDKLNKLRLASALDANDHYLKLNLSKNLIIAMDLELQGYRNRFSHGTSCGNHISLRYCYGRKLALCHQWHAKITRFTRYARSYGFSGTPRVYLITITPDIISPYVSPAEAGGDIDKLSHVIQAKLTSKLVAIHNELTRINHRVVRTLKKNRNITALISDEGEPMEPTSKGCGLFYHYHYVIISARPVSVRNIHARHVNIEPVKPNDLGRVLEYVAGQDDTSQDHSNKAPKRASHYQLCQALEHRYPWHFEEAIACFMSNNWTGYHWARHYFYWNRRNHYVARYLDHVNAIRRHRRKLAKLIAWLEHLVDRLNPNALKRGYVVASRKFEVDREQYWVWFYRYWHQVGLLIRGLKPIAWLRAKLRSIQLNLFAVCYPVAIDDQAKLDGRTIVSEYLVDRLNLYRDELKRSNWAILNLVRTLWSVPYPYRLLPVDYLVWLESPPG